MTLTQIKLSPPFFLNNSKYNGKQICINIIKCYWHQKVSQRGNLGWKHTRGGKDEPWERKRMNEMKDGRGWKLLIRWPGRHAWKKGFGLSCGPDPCLLDWHSNNPAIGVILQITPPTRERRQARIGENQTDERKRQGEEEGGIEQADNGEQKEVRERWRMSRIRWTED